MGPNRRVPRGAFQRLLDWRGGLVIRAAPIVMFVVIAVALGRAALQSFRGDPSPAQVPPSTGSLVPRAAADHPTAPAASQRAGGTALAAKSLVDQSAWWIAPLAVIALLMVWAMMECTRTLLAKPPPKNVRPVDGAELRRRLMALSGQPHHYQIVESRPWDLELDWDVIPASWQKHLAKIKLTTVYHARMLLDEARHDLRWFEILRTSSFFIGFNGLVPMFRWAFWVQTGYIDVVWGGLAYEVLPGFPPRIGRVHQFSVDTVAAKRDVRTVVSDSGWSFQPQIWWYQVRRSRDGHVPGAFLARAFPHWSERRFWGVLYPALYVMFFAYFFAIGGGWSLMTPRNLLPILLVSVLWWGAWAAITWVLLYMSEPRHQT